MVRVTEAAAIAAARWMGRGDKEAVDGAAVDAMRYALSSIDMDGTVIIGEGEKDEAPMLYIGEKIGNGMPPKTDVAVDPVDGTRLTALGLAGAVAVMSVSEAGSMYFPPKIVYMEKIAVGKEAAGVIDIEAPPAENLRRIARAQACDIADLTVVVLDRDRHKDLIGQIRAAGARIKLIPDGDVAGAITCFMHEQTGLDVMMGIGGSPEAVLAASAAKCLGGRMECKLWPRSDEERRAALDAGLNEGDLKRVFTSDDLVKSNDVFFAATGVTDGEMLKGVHFFGKGATTNSIVMRSRTGTIRRIDSEHHWEEEPYQRNGK
ncbi:MAG: class II fructose-bisphosphatase [Chloroflexi bacterium]|nr:class II fructose-bisphosphatase [Chloroflexota bacterium]